MNHRVSNLKRYLEEAGLRTKAMEISGVDCLFVNKHMIKWSFPERVFIVSKLNVIKPGKVQQVHTLLDTVAEVFKLIKENTDGIEETPKTQVL